MIKRKHPLDRAERRRLKTLKDYPGVRLKDIVSPEFIKDNDNARNPIELEVLERTPEAPVPTHD